MAKTRSRYLSDSSQLGILERACSRRLGFATAFCRRETLFCCLFCSSQSPRILLDLLSLVPSSPHSLPLARPSSRCHSRTCYGRDALRNATLGPCSPLQLLTSLFPRSRRATSSVPLESPPPSPPVSTNVGQRGQHAEGDVPPPPTLSAAAGRRGRRSSAPVESASHQRLLKGLPAPPQQASEHALGGGAERVRKGSERASAKMAKEAESASPPCVGTSRTGIPWAQSDALSCQASTTPACTESSRRTPRPTSKSSFRSFTRPPPVTDRSESSFAASW